VRGAEDHVELAAVERRRLLRHRRRLLRPGLLEEELTWRPGEEGREGGREEMDGEREDGGDGERDGGKVGRREERGDRAYLEAVKHRERGARLE